MDLHPTLCVGLLSLAQIAPALPCWSLLLRMTNACVLPRAQQCARLTNSLAPRAVRRYGPSAAQFEPGVSIPGESTVSVARQPHLLTWFATSLLCCMPPSTHTHTHTHTHTRTRTHTHTHARTHARTHAHIDCLQAWVDFTDKRKSIARLGTPIACKQTNNLVISPTRNTPIACKQTNNLVISPTRNTPIACKQTNNLVISPTRNTVC
jgi:hypothetical protein